MRTFATALVAAGMTLAASPAAAAITACPIFTTDHGNVLCLDKDPHFDERLNLSGSVYCSTAADGAPDGYVQVDRYVKLSGSSVWQGSCRASCSNLSQWPPLLLLPDVTDELCP
jgi:hypothetical protein